MFHKSLKNNDLRVVLSRLGGGRMGPIWPPGVAKSKAGELLLLLPSGVASTSANVPSETPRAAADLIKHLPFKYLPLVFQALWQLGNQL